MESKQQTVFVCLLLLLSKLYHLSANNPHPEIISTQNEIITYINHTAKLSCIIQNRNRQHVTWSRINFTNETQKLTNLLYVDLFKYTPFTRYHLSHLIENDNKEYWNLEIRQVHLSDQGYYSCVLTDIKPISKIFYVKVIDDPHNLPFALRSTASMQHLEEKSSLSNRLSISLTLITVSSIAYLISQ